MVATPRPGLKLKSLEALFSAPFSQAREDKLPVFEQNTRAHRALTANPVKSWVKWPPAPPIFRAVPFETMAQGSPYGEQEMN